MLSNIQLRNAGWASLDREVLSQLVSSLDRTQGFFHKVALWENWDEEMDVDNEGNATEGEEDDCWLDIELVLPYGFTETCNLEHTLSNFDKIARSVPTPELIPLSFLAFMRTERPLPPELGPTMLGCTMEKLRRILLNCPGVTDEMIFSERDRSQMLENLQHAHFLQASRLECRTFESQIMHWVDEGVLANNCLDEMPNRRPLTAEDIMSSAGWAKTKEGRERCRRISEVLVNVGELLRDRDGSTHKLMTLVVLTNGLYSAVDGRSLQGGGGFLIKKCCAHSFAPFALYLHFIPTKHLYIMYVTA